jgi:hypothetical protein
MFLCGTPEIVAMEESNHIPIASTTKSSKKRETILSSATSDEVSSTKEKAILSIVARL